MFTPVAVHTGTQRLGGVTRPGESWAAAATRIAGRPAYAVDLAGEVKEFSSDPMPVVALRAMTRGDLPHMVRWLSHDHVRRWYGADGEPTPAWVSEHYGPDIDGSTAASLWVIEANGRSIGFCQDYRISAQPDYALLTPDPDAIGFDYAIGEPAFVGRGIGPRAAWVWLTSVPQRYPDAVTCFAAPDYRNAASLRMLDKVGFERGTWFDEPQPDGSTTTMVGCSFDLRPSPRRHLTSRLGPILDTMSLRDELRLPTGPVDLRDYDTNSAPGVDADKESGKQMLAELGPRLIELQTKLFASKESSTPKRLLLVLQGMDTSGKGGVLKHTVGLVDPVGVRITSFKAPTEEERAHDFLWRVEKAVPEPGYLGVFDRSHYEDVLIGRVRELADAEEIERRYAAIDDFEKRLVDDDTVVLKCLLHISPQEQKKRLLARLEDPTKQWKYNPGDIDERQLWDSYREAYEIALERTNTEYAPWYLVPSDKKWYRNLAIGELLLETLDRLDLDWPAPTFDIAEEKKRLEEDTVS